MDYLIGNTIKSVIDNQSNDLLNNKKLLLLLIFNIWLNQKKEIKCLK